MAEFSRSAVLPMPVAVAPVAAKNEVVFRNTLEGLFTVLLKDRMTPRLREKVAVHGVTLPQLPMQLKRAQWNAVLREVAMELYPRLGSDEAHFKLGCEMTHAFAETVRGRAQAAMAKILGPRRLVEHFRTNLSTGGNFTEAKVDAEGERAMRFWINETGEQNPGFFAGLLTSALELAGATAVDVRLRSVSKSTGATYGVTWGA